MRPRVAPADLLTIGNGICGFLALATLATTWLHTPAGPGLDHSELVTCLLLYGIGMLFDVLDGPVARRLGSSGLGTVLDTISDTISFGMLPAMLLLVAVGSDVQWRAPAVVAAAVYMGATMLRLARHAQRVATREAPGASGAPHEASEHAAESYAGMPAPVAGNCVLAVVVLGAPTPLVVTTAAAAAVLMVSDFRFPNNDSLAGVLVATLLVASFLGVAGVIPLEIPAAAALIVTLPLALFCVVTRRGSATRRGG